MLLFFVQPANIQRAPEGYTFFVTSALLLMKPVACGLVTQRKALCYRGYSRHYDCPLHLLCTVVDRLAVGGFISWLAGRHRYSLLCSWRSEYCAHILPDSVTGLMDISIAGLRQCLHELAGTGQFYVHSHAVKDKAIPLHAWTGPKASRRLMLPDFKTVGTWRL